MLLCVYMHHSNRQLTPTAAQYSAMSVSPVAFSPAPCWRAATRFVRAMETDPFVQQLMHPTYEPPLRASGKQRPPTI